MATEAVVDLLATPSDVETDQAFAAAPLAGTGDANTGDAIVEGFAWPSDEELLHAERGPSLGADVHPASERSPRSLTPWGRHNTLAQTRAPGLFSA